jgi:hypothetical protein
MHLPVPEFLYTKGHSETGFNHTGFLCAAPEEAD